MCMTGLDVKSFSDIPNNVISINPYQTKSTQLDDSCDLVRGSNVQQDFVRVTTVNIQLKPEEVSSTSDDMVVSQALMVQKVAVGNPKRIKEPWVPPRVYKRRRYRRNRARRLFLLTHIS